MDAIDDLIEHSTYLKIGTGNFPSPASDMILNQGLCGIYKFKIKKDSVAYRYDVEIYQRNFRESDPKKQKHLTRGIDEGLRIWNRAICAKLISEVFLLDEFKQLVSPFIQFLYVYDSGKNIFFNQDLKNLDGKVFVVDVQKLNDKQRAYLKNNDVEVVFNKSASYVLKLDNVASALCSPDKMQPDRSLRTFLELLLNQGLLSSKENLYDMVGIGRVYKKYLSKRSLDILNATPLPYQIIVREGFQKGVRIVDPNAPTPAVVIDAKASAFYPAITLDKVIDDNKQKSMEVICNALTKMYKGVRACLTYDYSTTILISKFNPTSVKDMKIKIKKDGVESEITLYEFYQQKGISINRSQLPVVIADGKYGRAYAPELVYILPMQRVPIQAMESNISDALRNINLTFPLTRLKVITKSFYDMKTLSANYLNAFGVELLDDNRIQIGYRKRPMFQMDNRKFIDRKNINLWAIYYVENDVTPRDLDLFVLSLIKTAKKFGITVRQPRQIKSFTDFSHAELHFKNDLEFKKLQCLLFISQKNEDLHNQLKMTEMRYRVITQHLVPESIRSEKRITLENIVFKWHVKNAGLNYVMKFEEGFPLNLSTGNILVISYDVSHPGKSLDKHELWKVRQELPLCDSLEPSVVGYCANTMPNPHGFSGDYFFQESRRESVNSEMLAKKAEEVMKMFLDARKHFPKIVFVIRDGVSEGQFEMAANQECIALKKGCLKAIQEKNPNADIRRTPFVFTIVSKRHNKRFFMNEQERVSNPKPVSVIDRGIVRADAHEFFMQSYTNNKGTVKMPQYVTIINEANMSSEDLQKFFVMLCHSHQIVQSAISLPEPVHLANELAKRGRNNFSICRKEISSVKIKSDSGFYNFDTLNSKFTYNEVSIRNQRFTA